MGSNEDLYELWMLYTSKGDVQYFKDYLGAFVKCYESLIDKDYIQLNEGFNSEGPHLTKLPDGFLETLTRQLEVCVEATRKRVDWKIISYSESLTKALIIICRNLDNIALVASCKFVVQLVTIATVVIKQLCTDGECNSDIFQSFLHHALHFLECIYDPYFVWNRRIHGLVIDKKKLKYKPALIHVEVVPFFYECFLQERSYLDVSIQARLMHLFGAVISGSHINSLKAISPATLHILLTILGNVGNDMRAEGITIKDVVLKCLVRMIHVLHCATPDHRQVEVSSVLEGFLNVLDKLSPQSESDEAYHLQLKMLETIGEMLQCRDKVTLQAAFASLNCFGTFIHILQKTNLTGSSAQNLAVTFIKSLAVIMMGSASAKDGFRDKVGYKKLNEALKSLGQPNQELLAALLNLVFESNPTISRNTVVHNPQAATMLIQWLPDIQSHELQIWLTENLLRLCTQNILSKMQCCAEHMISAVLGIMHRERQINQKALGHLISLMEVLGSHSITVEELKQLISLLRPDEDGQQPTYVSRLMHAMSVMASQSDREHMLYYFDLQDKNAGIAISEIRKWPGSNFSFHGWIRLDNDPDAHILATRELVRRQLYSFFTSTGTGFEAFFTLEGILVIAVCTKKDYFVVEVSETSFSDGLWHCLDIVHSTSRRPFTQSQMTVYIDSVLIHSSQLKFPSLSEPFIHCCIGSAGPKTNVIDKTFEGPSGSPTLPQSSSSFPLPIPAPLKNSSQPTVHSIPAGTQDDIWGCPISLRGQVGYVCVFHEPLQYLQIKSMYSSGPNSRTLFRSEDGTEISDLGQKLVLYYHPKACKDYLCCDLSAGHMYNGRLTGLRCVTNNIKDVINCIGGVEVLFPLLQQAQILTNSSPESSHLSVLHACRSPSEEIHDDWIIVSNSSYSGRLWVPKIRISPDEDANLEQNQVAGFLTLLKNIIRNNSINQEQLVQTHGMATIGALLQKVNASMIDVHVLMATQLLIEAIGTNNITLLHNIYQYILFDFRIWSKSDFPVRIGHIQYLSTIIKDDRKYFRKKYGVQYMLDIIRIYYSVSHGLTSDDAKAIRVSLLGLIKFFIAKEITFEELHQILAFMTVITEEGVMIEILDMLLSILENPHTRDQIFLLMFEPNCSELLYMLLLHKEFSVSLKGKLLKIISILLKTQKVYEKSKSRLRLHDVGYAGLISLMQGTDISMEMAMALLDQVLMTDNSSSYQGVLIVVQLLQFAEIDIKIEAARKILTALFMKPGAPELMSKQLGWQDSITRLLIQRPMTLNSTVMELLPNPVTANQISSIMHNNQENPIELMEEINIDTISDRSPEMFSSSIDTVSESENFAENFCSDNLNLPSPLQFLNSKGFDENTGFEMESMAYSRSHSSSCTASLEDLSNSQSDSVSIASTPTTTFIPASLPTPDNPNGPIPSLDSLRTWEILSIDSVSDKDEELCQMVLNILFTILWRGVNGSDKNSWIERGQVLTCLNMLAMSNKLYKSDLEFQRRLLEMLIQVVHKDLKDATQAYASYTENAVQVMRIVHDFVITERKEDCGKKLSEKLIEAVSTLLDTLMVWEDSPGEEWAEMAQMGLSILLVFVESDNLSLCAIASAKLHTLLQTRGIQSPDEACYLLGTMDSILSKAVEANNLEHYSFVIPVIKALLEKTSEVTISKYLPNLPHTSLNPTFFEDFQHFALTTEWKHFIEHQMGPGMMRYKTAILQTQRDMYTFWNECYEATMVSVHKRNREMGESKLRFQSEIMSPFNVKCKAEINRFNNLLIQIRTQTFSIMRQWCAVSWFLNGRRGAWSDRNPVSVHWKLLHHENFSRMRLKLVPNPNFDSHTDASRLRDNLGGSNMANSEQVPLAVVKEAIVSEFQEDSLTEEDLNMLRATSINDKNSEIIIKDKIILSEDCQLVTIMDIITGRLEVTNTNMCFYDASPKREDVDRHDFKWPLTLLREVHLRRYNLRRSALEFFLIDQTNYFLNFTTKTRNKVYSRILSLRPPNLSYFGTRSPAELLKASGLIQRWVNRELSNFDYLMQLNTIAGRTYNDLSQYPVFPWILSDYTSAQLDLNDPAVFRDLSKPIGVVNPKNCNAVKEKYENFEDPTGMVDKFHYGTHYSNAAGVMHYMVRMEPFTTLHIQLQSGRFDVADRQFHSIPATWKMLMENPYDVKELIPEFFYLPEFLVNHNKFDLGKLQITKERVTDVILPNWAKSAEDFIFQHQKALECEYVSSHLNEWIDLIFGYKQRGPTAVEALNVFYYCTYEGAVDLDAITDPVIRRATEGMINNFGQTPCQLLKEPHPRRISYEEAMLRAAKFENRRLNIFQHLTQLKAFFVEVSENDALIHLSVPRSQVRSFIQHGMPDTMVTVSEKGILGIHGWLPYDKNISNYFTFEKDPTLANAKTRRKVGGPFQPGLAITSNLFVVSHDARLLFSGGHWDNSLRVFSISKNKLVNVIIRHIDVVTCVALDYCGNHLITGSKDTTSMIWKVIQQAGISQCVIGQPLQILCGHDSEVTCVAISTELDMAVSGSKDGTINIYSVRKGYYLRTLEPPGENPNSFCVNLISLSDQGQIIAYCQYKEDKKEDKLWLHLYSINGKHLAQEHLTSPITDMLVSGDHLVTGNNFGQLMVREIFRLKTLNVMPLHVPICCITVINNSCINNSSRTHILAGLKDGKLIVIGVSSTK